MKVCDVAKSPKKAQIGCSQFVYSVGAAVELSKIVEGYVIIKRGNFKAKDLGKTYKVKQPIGALKYKNKDVTRLF